MACGIDGHDNRVTSRLIRGVTRTRWQVSGGPLAARRVSTSIKDHMNRRSSSEPAEPHSRRLQRSVNPTGETARETHVTAPFRLAIG